MSFSDPGSIPPSMSSQVHGANSRQVSKLFPKPPRLDPCPRGSTPDTVALPDPSYPVPGSSAVSSSLGVLPCYCRTTCLCLNRFGPNQSDGPPPPLSDLGWAPPRPSTVPTLFGGRVWSLGGQTEVVVLVEGRRRRDLEVSLGVNSLQGVSSGSTWSKKDGSGSPGGSWRDPRS